MVKTASCTWCYLLSGEIGADIRQGGRDGPLTVSGGKVVLGAGPHTVLSCTKSTVYVGDICSSTYFP